MPDLQRTGLSSFAMQRACHIVPTCCMCLPLRICTTAVGSAAALQRHHNPQLHKCMQQICRLTASIGTITATHNNKLYHMYQLPALNQHAIQLLRQQHKALFENTHEKSTQYDT